MWLLKQEETIAEAWILKHVLETGMTGLTFNIVLYFGPSLTKHSEGRLLKDCIQVSYKILKTHYHICEECRKYLSSCPVQN